MVEKIYIFPLIPIQQSALASLYSSEGSVMEVYTFLDVLYGGLHVIYMHAYIGETAKKHMWCSVCIKFNTCGVLCASSLWGYYSYLYTYICSLVVSHSSHCK